MNSRLKKQQVVYNKTSGEIKLVVSIDKRPFSIKELNLVKVNDTANETVKILRYIMYIIIAIFIIYIIVVFFYLLFRKNKIIQ